MNYLITGGTGSLGQKLAAHLKEKSDTDRIAIYSRDEYKQTVMAGEFGQHGKMRYFIGDVRDEKRLKRALQGIDVVIHTAALKVVPKLEYNPAEAVLTNIIGTMNVINACVESEVEKAIFLSTDKAVMPINLYGATKMTAERIWLDACFYKPIFAVVRYGNVMGSRGSVLELYKRMHDSEMLPLTHEDMTRFWTTFEQAIRIIETAIIGDSQVIYIPNSPAFRMFELIRALDKRPVLIDMRPGEKLHESLISEHELPRAFFFEDHYRILPELPWDNERIFQRGEMAADVLTSEDVTMTRDELRELYEFT